MNVKDHETIAPSKGTSIVLSMLFISIIILPLLNDQFNFFSEKENPKYNYSSKPELTIESIDTFPSHYEKYYNERVGFTTMALNLNAYVKLNFLKVSPNESKILLGKNNWLFDAVVPIDDYRGSNLLSAAEIEKLKNRLHSRAANLKAQGGTFYFAVVPNKHRVYPEFLPNNIIQHTTRTVFDQVVEALQGDTLIHLIDLRAPLEKAKSYGTLYYKTDDHWNHLGAYVGYRSIIEKVQEKFHNVSPVSRDAYDLDTTIDFVGGNALQVGIEHMMKEHRVLLKPKTKIRAMDGKKQNYPPPPNFAYGRDFEIVKVVNDSSLPSAVIIRDSFCDFMLDFFSENFKKTVFIFDMWQYKENRNIIEKEKPDIVILETLEQNIRNMIVSSDE